MARSSCTRSRPRLPAAGLRYYSRVDRTATIVTDHLPAIREFCERWRIVELSLFGSVLRPDFRADSDIDVLVQFEPGHPWTVLDHLEMERELSVLLRQRVEITSRSAIEASPNWIRKREILSSAQTLYAA